MWFQNTVSEIYKLLGRLNITLEHTIRNANKVRKIPPHSPKKTLKCEWGCTKLLTTYPLLTLDTERQDQKRVYGNRGVAAVCHCKFLKFIKFCCWIFNDFEHTPCKYVSACILTELLHSTAKFLDGFSRRFISILLVLSSAYGLMSERYD